MPKDPSLRKQTWIVFVVLLLLFLTLAIDVYAAYQKCTAVETAQRGRCLLDTIDIGPY